MTGAITGGMFNGQPLTGISVGGQLVWSGDGVVVPVAPANPGDPVATYSTPHLAFDMPERELLTASPKKAYAHYFTPFPVSVNNPVSPTDSEDWYHNKWIGRPNGTGDVTPGVPDPTSSRVYGGRLRDRPRPRPRRTPPSGVKYEVLDMVDEVNWARDAGYDGWMLDMLGVGTGNQRWTQQLDMHAAIERTGHADFHLGLMPDANTSAADSVTALADAIISVKDRPSTLRTTDGRLVISPYGPESKGAQFWADVIARVNAAGENVFFVPCFSQSWTGANAAPAHASISQGMGRWGDRDPVNIRTTSVHNMGAVDYMRATYPGKLWMHPVSPGDERPNGNLYWERWGLRQWCENWSVAIEIGADWVQIPTFNDISEHSHIVPSVNHGYSYLDVGAYYLIRYKLGYWPKIKRDAGYLSHRIRPSWTPPTQGQPSSQVTYQGQTAWQNLTGATPRYNDVEVLVFLTDDAEVQITSGGQTTTHQVIATGRPQRVLSSLKGAGPVSAVIRRNGQTVQTMTGTQPVVATPWTQDEGYRVISSRRQALGQQPTGSP